MLLNKKMGACRRCGGQLCRERDVFGDSLACIQCGATYVVPVDVKLASQKLPAVAVPQKVPVAASR